MGIRSLPGDRSALTALIILIVWCALPCMLAAASDDRDGRAGSSSTHSLLTSAFAARYDLDLVQLVEIETTERGSTIHRTVQMASKRIDGRVHALGYIVAPVRLRDTRLLMIENRDRSDDFFIFMPAVDKVRRIVSSRHGDSFLGTGLSYEDLERRHVDDYDVSDAGTDTIGGEPVRVVAARPRYESGHDVALYYIATADHAIREVRYYRGDRERLLRVQRVPRDAILRVGENLLPTRIEVDDLAHRSKTTVTFSQITVNPELDDALFTRTAVELGRPIPHLGRGGEESAPAAQ